MPVRSVQEWFKLIQTTKDDLKLVRQVLAELDDDSRWGGISGPRQEHLLSLLTAIRLDQMSKEHS